LNRGHWNNMKKEDARKAIVSEWLRLPASERATEHQAVQFAMKAKERYSWRASGDPYQEVKTWISGYIAKP
jgi:hypothetical protein